MTVPDCDHQSLQHFISDSKWDEEGVISEIQRRVSALIGNAVHGSVHLDESGYIKGGERSVGVKRQYCGRIGKVDNCQVGVFLGYALWTTPFTLPHEFIFMNPLPDSVLGYYKRLFYRNSCSNPTKSVLPSSNQSKRFYKTRKSRTAGSIV